MALSPVCVVGGLLLIRRPVILEVVHLFKPSYVPLPPSLQQPAEQVAASDWSAIHTVSVLRYCSSLWTSSNDCIAEPTP